MQAKDIMTTAVVTTAPDATVGEIASLMLERRISALPVVDADGRIRGIVSEGDLMRRPESGTEPHHSWWLRLIATPDENAGEYLKVHGLTAGDVMTHDVVTADAGTSAGDIAELLERRHIKRVPVLDKGKVVGIVSRADLLRALASHKRKISAAGSPSDTEIRDRLLKQLRAGDLPGEAWINPIVVDGVVNLWGLVESQKQRDAVRVAAESTEGVKSVVTHLGILTGTARTVLWAE